MINTINKIYNLVLKYKGGALSNEECKLFQKLEKSNKDELQELLNAVNDKIIDLSNVDSKNEIIQTRKCAFYYFKGMILALMDERKNRNGKNK